MIEIGGWIFWTIIAIVFMLEWGFINSRKYTSNYIGLLVVICFIIFCTNLDYKSISYDIVMILSYATIYVVFGILWSFPWLLIKLSSIRDLAKEAIISWNKLPDNSSPMHDSKNDYKHSFSNYICNNYYKYEYKTYPVNIKELKYDIINHSILWPLSIIDTFLTEILSKFWSRVFTLFSGVYQRLTNYVLPTPPEK